MLEQLDRQLFLLINSFNSPFFDQVMYIISGKLTWVPLYIVILVAIGRKYQRKFYPVILFISLAVLLADQGSVQIFKNTVQRLRPCHESSLEGMVHLVENRCGGLYGFVSSHASNAFNVALISLLFIRKKWFSVSIVIWAALVGYSRIYLGVHYPGDVICGSLFGTLTGWSVYKLYELTEKKYLQRSAYYNPDKTS